MTAPKERTLSAELSYRLLEEKGAPPLGELTRMAAEVDTPTHPAVFAIDHEMRRHLLVPTDATDHSLTDRGSPGIHLTSTWLVGEAGRTPYIDLLCPDSRFARLFSRFADDLVSRLGVSGDPARTCTSCLARWRDMFRRVPDRALSPRQACALLGELVQLERLAASHPHRALKTWTGWEKDRVDFRGGASALEVKATLAREGWSVRIHGLDQLDDSTFGELHLIIYRFERVAEGGTTLPEVIQRLLDLGVDSAELHARLFAVGYSPLDASYDALRFDERERRLYRVDHSFPKLIRRSLVGGKPPDGVTGLQYTVSLNSPTPAALASSDLEVVGRQLLDL